ncbi:hypothetical protein Tco_1475805 [Tanacetum coccineum]
MVRLPLGIEKEQNVEEKADTTLSLPSEEASPVVKGPLDASEVSLISLRSEDPNFKIQEKGVEYVRTLNDAPLEVVFAGLVDEVSSVIDDVFDIGESNVESMHVRGKFAEFSEDNGSVGKEWEILCPGQQTLKEGKGCCVGGRGKKSVGCGSGRRDYTLMGASAFALYNPSLVLLLKGEYGIPELRVIFKTIP